MRAYQGLGLGSAVLMLAACGSETTGEVTTADGDKAEYAINEDTGETSFTVNGPDGTATMRSGTGVPLSLPDGFTLYPGSKVISNTVVNQDKGEGTMVMFESTASPQQIVDHFRKQAEAAGIAIELDANMNGTMMIGGERKRDGTSLSVTASASDGEVTTGQLIIGTDPAS